MIISLQEFFELVKTTALVVGGLWAVWTFHKLRKVREAEAKIDRDLAETQKALAETQKILAETQKSHLDQQEGMTRLLRQQPELAVELSVTESWDLNRSQGCLCVNVALEDKGEQNLKVWFHPTSLAVGYVDPKEGIKNEHMYKNYPSYYDPNMKAQIPMTERDFRVGQRRNMVFTVPITKAGAYFIQFHAAYWKIAFDGQEETEKDPRSRAIYAVEQMIYHATGRTTSHAALPSSAPDNLQGERNELAPP
jgi:hypothetical protein